MNKKLCYYAHSMLSYGSTIEKQDIEMLQEIGFTVINPSASHIKQECEDYMTLHGKDKVMDFFKNIVELCDVVAFRSLPNGEILSGISAEVSHAILQEIPIIEIPCSVQKRMLDYPATKQILIELGHYKV